MSGAGTLSAAILLGCAAAAPAPAAPAPQPDAPEPSVVSTAAVEVLNYGLWRPAPGAPTIVRLPGMLSGVGYHYSGGEFYQRTTTICAAIGTHFAFSYRLAAAVADPVWPLRLVVDHPLMTRPDGRQARQQTADTYATHAESREGWGFDRPYELVEGSWTMALWHDKALVAKVTFDVRTACARVTS